MQGGVFESSDLLSLFPTPVWELQLPAQRYEPINASVLGLLRDLRGCSPPLAPGSAWQSPRDLHLRRELSQLVECIDAALERVLGFLKISHSGFEITGCWANVNAAGASHRSHRHPNNFLSGVYYVRAPAGADSINFHDPRVQAGIIRPPVTALTAQNTDMVVTRVRDGRLLVFPAWLEHSVSPNEAATERISVSFNAMFSAYSETMSAPLW